MKKRKGRGKNGNFSSPMRVCVCVCVCVCAQSCLTLCGPMDYGLPGSSVRGIL